jgi:hypothetical protein
MAAALELHDELVAGTVDAHGRRLLKAKGEGDATLTVFPRASDAVACAAELQRGLHGTAWPGGLDLRVRVALHTGEAHERESDYFGPALNRAARLRALTRGGATVMSQATAEIVRERLPPEIELVELGRQELRGLSRPENVFELRAISEAVLAGESALGAPRTTVAGEPDALGGLPAPPTARVPAPLTRAIGREAESSAIARLLGRREIRVVTLTRAGGVGKTRLAVEIATVLGARWRDGWRFVSLGSLQAAEQVEATLAGALEVVVAEGERPREALARWLAPRELLLVIDNFEHLLPAAPLVSELLDAEPGVTVLATSREPLGLRGERVARVVGLSDEDGTELFLERARERPLPRAGRQRARGDRRHVPAPGRAAAGHRTDRSVGLPSADPAARVSAPATAGAPRSRRSRCPRAAAHTACDHRLELPPPRRQRPLRVRDARGFRWRLHSRGRPGHRPGQPARACRAARQVADRAPRRAARDARDPPRICRRAPGRARRRRRDSFAPCPVFRHARRGRRSRTRRARLGRLAAPPGRRN